MDLDILKENAKKDHQFSFQVPQHYQLNLATSEVFLPKFGWIKVKMHRDLKKGILKTATVSELQQESIHQL